VRGMIHNTLSEMIHRKTIWVFAVVTLLAIGGVLLSLGIDIDLNIQMDGADSDPFGDLVERPILHFVGSFMGFLVFLTVMATAGLFPVMLQKGTADFYLSKPLSRTTLYLFRLLSVWIVYGATIGLCGLLVMLTVLVGWGFFEWGLIMYFIWVMVSLLIWLSVTAFMGIVSGSTPVAIMTAFLIWFVQWGLQTWRDLLKGLVDSSVINGILDGAYYVLPKHSQLASLFERLVDGQAVVSWLPLWSSLAFAGVLMVFASSLFERTDY